MSDQQKTGVITSLEEVFLSREFGRSPSRGISFQGRPREVGEPPQLEQVFLSEKFGHPEAVAATTREFAPPTPALAVLPGRSVVERDNTRYRAIAAVSGVAAAALVVVGIVSGTGQPTKRPTVSAQGPSGSGRPGASGGGSPTSGGGPQLGPPSAGPGTSPAATPGSAGGSTVAQLASATSSSPEVIVEVPPGTTVAVVPTSSVPPPPTTGSGGGTPPPAPSGGGGVLTPLLVVVGNTVSTVGATVTSTSVDLGTVLPVASSVTGLLANLGVTVTDLGQSVVGIAT
ncbi:MAG TPA: hypothetical protein VG244_08010 [Acidimicrobiales bacterium]|jgi:hypothetical protein|nr:hypothetical protein [Acidimicrobiales bacterium]